MSTDELDALLFEIAETDSAYERCDRILEQDGTYAASWQDSYNEWEEQIDYD
jgi:hypothetical protein